MLMPTPKRSLKVTASSPVAGAEDQEAKPENWEADSMPVKGARPRRMADDEMPGAIVAHLRRSPDLLREFVLRIQHRRAALARGRNEQVQPVNAGAQAPQGPQDMIFPGIPAVRLAQAFIDARIAVPVPPVPVRVNRPAPDPNNEPAELNGNEEEEEVNNNNNNNGEQENMAPVAPRE